MDSTLIVFIYMLALLNAVQSITHFIERKNLYDRLMSRDLAEYKRISEGEPDKEPRKTMHQKAIEGWRSGKGG